MSEMDKSTNSNNSFFDPPIENYRFFYQGAGHEAQGDAAKMAGFTIKRRKKSTAGSIGERLMDRYTNPSLYRKNENYGTVLSSDMMSVDNDSIRASTQKHARNGQTESSDRTLSRKFLKKNKSVFDEYE